MSTDPGTRTSVVCSVAPMLSVRNGARAVEFYKSAFGAVEVYRIEDPGGAVVSRLSVGGAEFWLASPFALYGELGFTRLRNSSVEGTGVVDDHVRTILFGARVKIKL